MAKKKSRDTVELPARALTALARQGRTSLQVPTGYRDNPEMAEIPKTWLVRLRSGRLAVGREDGLTYLSRAGYEANREQLKEAWDTYHAGWNKEDRKPFSVYEAAAERHFDNVLKLTKKHAFNLEVKLLQTQTFLRENP